MDGWITIGTKLETKQFDKQIEKLERDINDYENILKLASKLELSSADVEDLELKIEKAKNRIISLKKQQLQVNDIGFNEASNGLEKISDSTSNIIKKIGRWTLAVFSVRSAYMLVQRASSTLAQYNEDYAASLEYIRFVVAQMIAPVLQGIVNLAFRLLSYINAIANAWFGINLFSKAGVNDFKKMAGSAASIKKSLQTAGFDEMNVLSDTSGGGGGAGGGTPSMDLSQMQAEIPSWVKWIADNKEGILASLVAIGTAIVAIKLGLTGIQGIGIGIALAGILLTIQDVIAFIQDPSWENFANVLSSLSIALAGVAIAMIAFNATNPVGWILLAVAAVAGIAAAVIDNWDIIKEKLSAAKQWIQDKVITPVATFFSNLWTKITTGVTNAVTKVKDKFTQIKTTLSTIFTTIIDKFKSIGTKVGDAISKTFKTVVNAVLKGVENILNSPIRAVNSLIGVINKVPGINLSKLPTFSLPRLAVGGIVNMPGRGVPVGGAITGESGKEGVIPLTNSQAMQELGETIGRYININATVVNKMNSRTISRELQKIQSNQDFAYNT